MANPRCSAFLGCLCGCVHVIAGLHAALCAAILQTYHGLRKIAGYCSLSDTGGNTDVVTRKVWATFVSMLDPPVRARDKIVVESLMLTDGDDTNRAVVEDVPLMRQSTARMDIAETKTGEPPSARSLPRKPARRRPPGSPASTSAAASRRGSRKRKGESDTVRRKTRRTHQRAMAAAGGGATAHVSGQAQVNGGTDAAAAAAAAAVSQRPTEEEEEEEEEEE